MSLGSNREADCPSTCLTVSIGTSVILNSLGQQMRQIRVAKHREPRLHLAGRLAPGGAVELEAGQAHYLRSVLRLARDAAVAGFNAADGEWLCRIAEIGKNRGRLRVECQLRSPESEPDLWLLFAPIKRARLDWLVEKATELGISALLPVWTARTQSERLNLQRLRAHAVEAAEQSERLSVPELRAPKVLQSSKLATPAATHCLRRGAGPANRRRSAPPGDTSGVSRRAGRRVRPDGA